MLWLGEYNNYKLAFSHNKVRDMKGEGEARKARSHEVARTLEPTGGTRNSPTPDRTPKVGWLGEPPKTNSKS